MSHKFSCPKCEKDYDVGALELFEVYEEDGKETEFTCSDCNSEFIITSCVTDWYFETDLSD